MELEARTRRGGLPTEADFLAAEEKLSDAYSACEDLDVRCRWISDVAGGHDVELPFAVTSQHVGLVAGFASFLTKRVDDLRELVKGIEMAVDGLEVARREQSHASLRRRA